MAHNSFHFNAAPRFANINVELTNSVINMNHNSLLWNTNEGHVSRMTVHFICTEHSTPKSKTTSPYKKN